MILYCYINLYYSHIISYDIISYHIISHHSRLHDVRLHCIASYYIGIIYAAEAALAKPNDSSHRVTWSETARAQEKAAY